MNPPPSPISGQLRIRPMRRKADVAPPFRHEALNGFTRQAKPYQKTVEQFLEFQESGGKPTTPQRAAGHMPRAPS
jgi:hypothetical protein